MAATFVCVGASAQTQARQTEHQARDLIIDTERIVESEDLTGWFTEEEAHRSMRPTMLKSVCRVLPEARERALEILQRRTEELGDARELFDKYGEMTSEVRKARRAERERDALARALGEVEDCPFWVKTDPSFHGLQTDADRLSLNLETGGLLQIRRTAGSWTFGGGGYGRILGGYGWGGDFTLLLGPEFGGGAMLRPNTQPTELVINYFPAIPVVFRFHDVAWHYDAELAPVALFQADDSSLSYGARIGGTIGVKALRIRGFIPWAGLAVAYEHYLPSGGRPRAHFARGGLRVGFMWAP